MNRAYASTYPKRGVHLKSRIKTNRGRFWMDAMYQRESGFKCAHCQSYVTTDPLLSGVNNRNHCPYCLWSRHLDLYEAGDRLAACKALMMPIGLTLKKTRKKYGKMKDGELMLIHQCVDCQKVSINRIAADDIPENIIEIFERSIAMDGETKKQLLDGGIKALEPAEISLVHAQLLGAVSSEP